MDQSVLAGVGNLLADEALWRARLSPLRAAGELDAAELDRLRRELRAAVRSAIRRGGVHTGALIAASPARRALPALRDRPAAGHRRRAHDVVVPGGAGLIEACGFRRARR